MSETEETPIAELMERDPLSLTDQDLDRIITKLRQQRGKFRAGNMKAGTPQKKKTATQLNAEKAEKLVGNLDLDLGL